MQIFIDIPDEMYDWYDNGFPDEDDAEKLWQIIKNGTLLPKHHGRLIDADELNKCIVDRITMPYVPINKIQNAPTIIEADKEAE